MNLDTFHFVRPWWLLGLIPLGWIMWRCLHHAYAGRSWRHVCDPHLLPHLLIGSDQTGGKGPWVLLGLGWTLALVALAGPVWSKLPQPVVQSQSALVIVLDLSRSMDAQDVRPSRLTRAKHKVLDILKRRTEGQTALVVFAQESFIVSPLTDDAKTIASMVPTLSTELMPVQGSRPEQALELADRLLEQSKINNGEILLITDSGEGGEVRRTVERLRQKGRILSVLAVGTEEGAPIPTPNGGFLKDTAGAIVISKLDVDALQRLAQSGGGRFVTLQTDDHDLDIVLESQMNHPSFTESEESERTTDRWREEGPWLVLAVLLVGVPAFRKGWLGAILLVGFLVPLPVHAWTWEELWSRPDQQGALQLEQGNPKQAAELFSDEGWRGVAQYQSGQYDQAAEAFAQQPGYESRYNQGNALARSGKFKEALGVYEQTLQSNPEHEDAQHNAELIRKLLEQQQQSQNGSGQEQENQQDSQSSSQGEKSQKGQDQESQGSNGQADPSLSEQKSSGESTSHTEALPSEENQPQQRGTDQESKQDSHDLAQDDESKRPSPMPQKGSRGTEPQESEHSQVAQSSSDREGDQEERQATQQWLRRIPDDPGGLLRQKFLLEHQRRGNVGQGRGPSW